MFAKFNIRTVLLSSSSLTEDMMEKLGMGPIKGPCWVGFSLGCNGTRSCMLLTRLYFYIVQVAMLTIWQFAIGVTIYVYALLQASVKLQFLHIIHKLTDVASLWKRLDACSLL